MTTPISVQTTQPLPAGALSLFQDASSSTPLALQTNVNMTLNQDDLTAIAIGAAESAIREKISALLRDQTSTSRALSLLESAQTTLLASWSSTMYAQAPATTLITAVQGLTNRAPIITHSLASYNERTNAFSGSTTLSDNGPSSFSFTINHAAPAPSEYLARRVEIATLTTTLNTIKTDLLNARAALNNVGALERMAKANLAASLASRAGDAGKKLVDDIRSTINTDNIIDLLRS